MILIEPTNLGRDYEVALFGVIMLDMSTGAPVRHLYLDGWPSKIRVIFVVDYPRHQNFSMAAELMHEHTIISFQGSP